MNKENKIPLQVGVEKIRLKMELSRLNRICKRLNAKLSYEIEFENGEKLKSRHQLAK